MTNKQKDIIAWISIFIIGFAVIVFFVAKKEYIHPVVKSNNTTVSSNANLNNGQVISGEVPHSQQSNAISLKEVSPKAIKLSVTAKGFSPSSFTVKRGKSIILSVTSNDNQTHIFVFDDKSLSGIAIGVGPGETRFIRFNAPKKAGIYKFHSDVPGQALEVGDMIVK